jgi:IS30 family transposase
MAKPYTHLAPEERALIDLMNKAGHGPSRIAEHLGRDSSTVSRELRRNQSLATSYSAVRAGERARKLRRKRRRTPKLAPLTPLFGYIELRLRQHWSPQQIARHLKRKYPNRPDLRVSHETIYTALYAMTRGQLKKDLLACLRHGHTRRLPRSRGTDRRGKIPDMVSIHLRPPEVEDRLVPGHWEGDLIKGAGNRSAVGTLVERTSRLILLVKLKNATAEAALEGFSKAFARIPLPLRQTLTYDQGREMACHKALSEETGLKIYFADPRSPWQRGTNENSNGLIRQFLPKGANLNHFLDEDLALFEWLLNTRPRLMHNDRTPEEVYTELVDATRNTMPDNDNSPVALGT